MPEIPKACSGVVNSLDRSSLNPRPKRAHSLEWLVSVDWMFISSYSGYARWNDAHWHNERFDNLLKEARAELDEKKRGEMYFECQKICRDEGGTIVHLFQDWVIATNKKVQHGKLAGNMAPDGAKAAERWWFG